MDRLRLLYYILYLFFKEEKHRTPKSTARLFITGMLYFNLLSICVLAQCISEKYEVGLNFMSIGGFVFMFVLLEILGWVVFEKCTDLGKIVFLYQSTPVEKIKKYKFSLFLWLIASTLILFVLGVIMMMFFPSYD